MTAPQETLKLAQDVAGQSFAPASGWAARSKFKTIVADPPWAYKNRMRGDKANGKLMVSVPFDEYPTMSIEEICALPVRDLAEDDAHLYLWTTQTFLRDTYRAAVTAQSRKPFKTWWNR